jgi:hypothetical protein
VAYFVEVGLLLIMVPWSAYWDRNYFAAASPLLRVLVGSNFVRGAVTGIGVVSVSAGLVDLAGLFVWRRH